MPLQLTSAQIKRSFLKTQVDNEYAVPPLTSRILLTIKFSLSNRVQPRTISRTINKIRKVIDYTGQQNFTFFFVPLTNFDFLVIYRYLTPGCGKVSTLTALSFAYYYVKVTSSEGSLNKVKR